MKEEIKFWPGETVWCLIGNKPTSCVITAVLVYSSGVVYHISNSRSEYGENDLANTRQELKEKIFG